MSHLLETIIVLFHFILAQKFSQSTSNVTSKNDILYPRGGKYNHYTEQLEYRILLFFLCVSP